MSSILYLKSKRPRAGMYDRYEGGTFIPAVAFHELQWTTRVQDAHFIALLLSDKGDKYTVVIIAEMREGKLREPRVALDFRLPNKQMGTMPPFAPNHSLQRWMVARGIDIDEMEAMAPW